MRIAIYAGTLRGYGSGNVGRGFLSGLKAICSDSDYEVWLPRDWRIDGERYSFKIHWVRSGILSKLYTENIRLRKQLKYNRFDSVISLTDTGMVGCHIPHLLFVQQAFLAYPPEKWPAELDQSLKIKFSWINAYFAAGINSVNGFVVQTMSMKENLSRKWNIPSEKIFVIPSAVSIDGDLLKKKSRKTNLAIFAMLLLLAHTKTLEYYRPFCIS